MPFIRIKDIKKYDTAPEVEKSKYILKPYRTEIDSADETYGPSKESMSQSNFEDQSGNSNQRGVGGELLRTLTGFGSNVAAGFGGVPANLVSLLNNVIGSTRPQDVKDFLNDPEKMKQLESNPEFAKLLKSPVIPEVLPTQEGIKGKISEFLPENYLKENQSSNKWVNEAQSYVNELGSDLGSLLFPIGGSAPKVIKALGLSAGSNAAKYLTKNLGGSKGLQEGVKLGTLMLGSLGFGDSLKKRASNSYKALDSKIPESMQIKDSSIDKAISNLYKESSSGGGISKSQEYIRDKILAPLGEHLSEYPNGYRKYKDVLKLSQNVNEHIGLTGRSDLKKAQPFLIEFRDALDSALKGPSVPKDIVKEYTKAKSLYNAAHVGKSTQEFIQRNGERLSNLGYTGATLAGLAGGTLGKIPAGMVALGKTISSDTGSKLIGKLPQFFVNVFKNPHARNEYIKLLGSAAKENTSLFLKHAKNLENIMDKKSDHLANDYTGTRWKRINNK